MGVASCEHGIVEPKNDVADSKSVVTITLHVLAWWQLHTLTQQTDTHRAQYDTDKLSRVLFEKL